MCRGVDSGDRPLARARRRPPRPLNERRLPDHGDDYWRRVATLGLDLAGDEERADRLVLVLFGLFRNPIRLNDGSDPEPWLARRPPLARALRCADWLTPECLALLDRACADHTGGGLSHEPTIGACLGCRPARPRPPRDHPGPCQPVDGRRSPSRGDAARPRDPPSSARVGRDRRPALNRSTRPSRTNELPIAARRVCARPSPATQPSSQHVRVEDNRNQARRSLTRTSSICLS